jgi:hypothetical protein
MHIVYLLKFQRDQLPNLYIGSKSNCSIIDGKIYDKLNKIYSGSCESKIFIETRETTDYTVDVLGEFDSYDDALLYEKDEHIRHDVVASLHYFNRSIATFSTFTNPDYAAYKNVETGKVVRLPRDHPEVLNGTWVGVTKGLVLTEEERLKRGRSGSENGFFGKTHSDETLKVISEKAKLRGSDPWNKRTDESKAKHIEMASRPKSEEHKRKIGRKGMVMLKSIETLKTIRVSREDALSYDPSVWMNPVRANKIVFGSISIKVIS